MGNSVGSPAYTDEGLDIIIPGSYIFIADRPIDCDAFSCVGFKVQVTPPVAEPAPEQRTATHDISPYPVEALGFSVRVFLVVDVPMLIVVAKRIMPALNVAFLFVLGRQSEAMREIPRIQCGCRIVRMLHVPPAVQQQHL